MKTLLEKAQSFFASLGPKFKRAPKSKPAAAPADAAASAPHTQGKVDRFGLLSWGVTLLIVVSLLVSAVLWKNANAAPAQLPQPTAAPDTNVNQPEVSVPMMGSGEMDVFAIQRLLQLKTNIPERPRYEPTTYRISRGD
ncbi:MAG: hypothetical protein AB1649_19455, partial [Chloroflexota bacterium]